MNGLYGVPGWLGGVALIRRSPERDKLLFLRDKIASLNPMPGMNPDAIGSENGTESWLHPDVIVASRCRRSAAGGPPRFQSEARSIGATAPGCCHLGHRDILSGSFA